VISWFQAFAFKWVTLYCYATGPLGKLPFLRKIAAGHTIHHTEVGGCTS
jgi:hypothetical protein